MTNRIAVIGATGNIGLPVTQALVEAGFEVVALVRDLPRARMVLPAQVSLVTGDLKDRSSLVRAMTGTSAVYINISTRDTDQEGRFSPESGGLENITSVAQECEVKHIAYLSSLLARNYEGDWWVMNAKKAGIAHVKASAVPHTIFYPSNFMENLSGGMLQGSRLMLAGNSPQQAWWIAGEDFGRQVGVALHLDHSESREFVIQGPEPMTMQEAATAFAKHYPSDSVKVTTMPMAALRFMAVFAKKMRFLTNLMAVVNGNEEHFEAQPAWDLLGTPQIALADYAAGVGAQ